MTDGPVIDPLEAVRNAPRTRAEKRAASWARAADQTTMLALAGLLGIASGYASLAFRLAVEAINLAIFGATETEIVTLARELDWATLLLAPTLGGLAIGLICQFAFKNAFPQGVADVMAAAPSGGGRLSLREGFGAASISAASIGCGASLGREGPIIHLGACIAAGVAKRFRMGAPQAKTLLGAGVAAAIAAAFNAPMAGAFFALEVVVGHYGAAAFARIALAAAVGAIIVRLHLGDAPVFRAPEMELVSFGELPAFVLLGLVCGASAVAFSRGAALVEASHARIGAPLWVRPALGGLALGAISLAYPEAIGVGYEVTDAALNGLYPLSLLITLAIVKGLATAICAGSRFGGGVFSPSLAMGALTGGAFGLVAASFAPELASHAGAYAFAGMAAFAGATLGAPISTVVMAFELTGDYGVTLALMPAVAAAALVHRQLGPASFFHGQLERRGQRLDERREARILRSRKVSELMRKNPVTAPAHAPLSTLKSLYKSRHSPIFVTDDRGELMGVVTFDELADAAFVAGDVASEPSAGALAKKPPGRLTPEDDLGKALATLDLGDGFAHVPVVAHPGSLRIVGELREVDLMRAYHRAMLEARAQERAED